MNLDACTGLKRVDVSENRLNTLKGFEHNTKVKWLNASGNRLTSLEGIERMGELQVLNCSHNQLQGEVKTHGMEKVGALILNNNDIVSVLGLPKLKQLNTLVLSNNRIEDLGGSLKQLMGLKKLSAAHNNIREIGKCLKKCTELQELRLGHNRIAALPEELSHNGNLKVLDLGHNVIAEWAKVSILVELRNLRNLNLSGNPITAKPGYKEQLLDNLPWLDILDGQVLHPERKRSRKRKEPTVEQVLEAVSDPDPDRMNKKIRFKERDDGLTGRDSGVPFDPVDHRGSFFESVVSSLKEEESGRTGSDGRKLLPSSLGAQQTGVVKVVESHRPRTSSTLVGRRAVDALLEKSRTDNLLGSLGGGWEEELPSVAALPKTPSKFANPSHDPPLTSQSGVLAGPKIPKSKRWALGKRKKSVGSNA